MLLPADPVVTLHKLILSYMKISLNVVHTDRWEKNRWQACSKWDVINQRRKP